MYSNHSWATDVKIWAILLCLFTSIPVSQLSGCLILTALHVCCRKQHAVSDAVTVKAVREPAALALALAPSNTQIGRLNLTASAFNQLGQYTSSPGCRGYCYAELTVFFPSGGRNHRQYSLHLRTEGWPGWVGLGGWLRSEIVYLPEGSHPSQY